MIEIMQLGYVSTGTREYQCTQCSCIFRYSKEDVGTIVEYHGGPNVDRFSGITCPCCGKHIRSEDLRYNSKEILKPYNKENVSNKSSFKEFENKNKKEKEN